MELPAATDEWIAGWQFKQDSVKMIEDTMAEPRRGLDDEDLEKTELSLPEIRWSRRTALDPRHRPQVPEKPSTTVRREWARSPQEAHVLDGGRTRIRRLTAREIAGIHGFEHDWIDASDVGERDAIKAVGDAVPPPLAKAVLSGVVGSIGWANRNFIEICAGAGGLTSGVTDDLGFEPLALIEYWMPACRILRTRKPRWAKLVKHADVRSFPFGKFRDQVGLFLGGPPCQPWSRSGAKQGTLDPRDLMGQTPRFLAAARPEAFVFENVPGLLEGQNEDYFSFLIDSLRHPATDVSYAVMAAVFNAADFGVPQTRSRLFIVGLRDRTHKDLAGIFDKIEHSGMNDRASWRPLSTVLELENDAKGWMRWPYGQLNRERGYRSARNRRNGALYGETERRRAMREGSST
jgi:site-specific DNA-cytosine methylase